MSRKGTRVVRVEGRDKALTVIDDICCAGLDRAMNKRMIRSEWDLISGYRRFWIFDSILHGELRLKYCPFCGTRIPTEPREWEGDDEDES